MSPLLTIMAAPPLHARMFTIFPTFNSTHTNGTAPAMGLTTNQTLLFIGLPIFIVLVIVVLYALTCGISKEREAEQKCNRARATHDAHAAALAAPCMCEYCIESRPNTARTADSGFASGQSNGNGSGNAAATEYTVTTEVEVTNTPAPSPFRAAAPNTATNNPSAGPCTVTVVGGTPLIGTRGIPGINRARSAIRPQSSPLPVSSNEAGAETEAEPRSAQDNPRRRREELWRRSLPMGNTSVVMARGGRMPWDHQ